MRGAGVALSAAVALAACSSARRTADPGPIAAPTRTLTAGDRLLARAPAGAALLLEIDLARLRANPTIGAMVSAFIDGQAALPVALPARLAGADAVLIAAYRIGSPEATAITIVEGGVRPDEAIALDGRVWALTDEGETAALLATAAGGASMASDAAMLALRAQAMPSGAEGASLRLAARLDGPARKNLTATLGLGPAPTTISLWADVADDLAVIAHLGDGADQAATLRALRDRLAGLAEVRALGVAPSVTAVTIARDPAGARAVLVIGPARLARAVARWQAVQP